MLVGVTAFDVGWGGIQIQTYNHIIGSEDNFVIFADSHGEMSEQFKALPNVKEIVICEDHEIPGLAKDKRIDVFIHHTVNHTQRGSLIGLKSLGIPIVVFHHCAWKPIYNSNIIDGMITTSDNNKLIIKRNETFKDFVIDKIHLSLDFTPYDNVEEVEKTKRKYGIPLDRIVIGRMGRLEPGKCPDDFLKAAHIISRKQSKVFFIVGGALSVFQSQDYLKGLKNVAREQELKDGEDILFTGSLSEQEKANLLNCMDVFLYPTRWEGYCMAFLEAMYLGKPVVTYDNFANAETIGSGGVAVKDGDVSKLAQQVLRLIRDDKVIRDIGRAGRKLVIDRNGVGEFCKKINAVLDRVVPATQEVFADPKSVKPVKRAKSSEGGCKDLALVGWGCVDGMESIPEYLQFKHFQANGLNVDFFCVTQDGASEFGGVKINRVKTFDPGALSTIPDVVHIHHAENPLSIQAAMWAKKANIPVTMNIHSFTISPDKFIPLVDKFIVFSEKEFSLRVKKIPKEKLVVIPNGRDTKVMDVCLLTGNLIFCP